MQERISIHAALLVRAASLRRSNDRCLPGFFFCQEPSYRLTLGFAGIGIGQLLHKKLQVLIVNEPFHGTALPTQEQFAFYHGEQGIYAG